MLKALPSNHLKFHLLLGHFRLRLLRVIYRLSMSKQEGELLNYLRQQIHGLYIADKISLEPFQTSYPSSKMELKTNVEYFPV
ncbi:hypothetical protein RIR_jg21571.t1 [Rhizophagus irregularis DAOM 181602=DAOM 197198]|nr:hypothetical protein RIR_jg21571.t1 [Rhizophagus irregularis DAOM 181602=DAOM 197198]